MIVNCLTCGKPFYTKPARLADGRGIYCSMTCRSFQRKKPELQKICKRCGKNFFTKKEEREYCGAACHNSDNARDPIERFWEKVFKPISADTCWIWTEGTCRGGYGKFTIIKDSKQKTIRSHRFSYELTYGPISQSTNVLHKCDNPLCVRPNHLFIGSHEENIIDKVKKNRQAKGEKIRTAKLNADSVRTIRVRIANGDHIPKIAEDYHIAVSNVYAIGYRKTWKHIP